MIRKIILKILKIYKKFISPVFEKMGVHCKYYPTCSEYMKQSINKYGIFKGGFKGIKRFLKCNPLSKGGYDPVK